MLLEELYVELLTKLRKRKDTERERFYIYTLIGDVMERYRETREHTLIEEFKNRFKHILTVEDLWENEEKEDDDDCLMVDLPRETIKNSYSRLNHVYDCMKNAV